MSARDTRLVVFVTCATAAEGSRLAEALVRRRLAACVNVSAPVVSYFRWKGKLERAREVLLVMKTTAARFDALRQVILTLHSYDVPEIIGWPMTHAHAPYARWVSDSVRA